MSIAFLILVIFVLYLFEINKKNIPFIQKTNNIIMEQKGSKETKQRVTDYKYYLIAIIIILLSMSGRIFAIYELLSR